MCAAQPAAATDDDGSRKAMGGATCGGVPWGGGLEFRRTHEVGGRHPTEAGAPPHVVVRLRARGVRDRHVDAAPSNPMAEDRVA